MTKPQIAAAVKQIVANQLDDARRAVKDGTKTIALRELEDAMRQLKALAALLDR
jgi:3-deoxy-D-manno-octulosonic acid (KDO) 8-phosphate synthase